MKVFRSMALFLGVAVLIIIPLAAIGVHGFLVGTVIGVFAFFVVNAIEKRFGWDK